MPRAGTATDAQLAGWMRAANDAQQGVERMLNEFYQHCEAGNWVQADLARTAATAYTEAHCDNVMAIQKALKG